MLVVNSLCKNIFLIFFSKFPVFSLSGKMDFQIPCFPCAVATLLLLKLDWKTYHYQHNVSWSCFQLAYRNWPWVEPHTVWPLTTDVRSYSCTKSLQKSNVKRLTVSVKPVMLFWIMHNLKLFLKFLKEISSFCQAIDTLVLDFWWHLP